jgi:two-component system, chemotaxis family, chemotaxis protein CheY
MSEIHALVIDDSGIMRKMVMRTLQQTGLATFAFTEAEDGADGLAKFNPRVTDIVFVDWNMPNMDGMDFVRRLRGQHPDRPVPIVMVTTEKLVQKVEEALEDGVDCFISKPFTTEGVEKRLAPVVEKLQRAKQPSGFFQRLVA